MVPSPTPHFDILLTVWHRAVQYNMRPSIDVIDGIMDIITYVYKVLKKINNMQ